MMIIDNKFNIGDTVFLKTCPDQSQRIITHFIVRKEGFMYAVNFGTVESWHYDFELSLEKDVLITSSN